MLHKRMLTFVVLIGLGGGLCRLPASGPARPFTPTAAADLARISHQLSAAASDSGMSTALRSVGRLDVLSSTPAAPSGRAPCTHARLRRLATKAGEKSGLAAAVANLQNRYASVRTVSADFRQTYRAPGMQQTESGVLLMKKPGLMRWEYRDPEVKLFVADGSTSYLYAPQDRQVMVSRLSAEDLRSTPLQFLLGRGKIAEAYDASWEPEVKPHVEGTLLLRLAPRARAAEYAYLVVEFDERTFDLRRIVIREQTGNTSEFLLTNLQTDVRIDDKNFRFKIPKGVEVVRLDEK